MGRISDYFYGGALKELVEGDGSSFNFRNWDASKTIFPAASVLLDSRPLL